MTQYATIVQLQTHLGMPGTLSADVTANMNLALTNASAVIDDQCHTTFAAATDGIRYFDAISDVDGRTLWLDMQLCGITTVTNGDGVTVAATNFVTEPRNQTPWYALTLRQNSSVTWTYTTTPEKAISITGKWAYSVTPPDAIVQTTLRLGAWFYRQPSNALDLDRAVIVGNTTIAPSAIPADVFVILRPYMRVIP